MAVSNPKPWKFVKTGAVRYQIKNGKWVEVKPSKRKTKPNPAWHKP